MHHEPTHHQLLLFRLQFNKNQSYSFTVAILRITDNLQQTEENYSVS